MTKTILILAANPKDTSRLRLDQEVREIDNGLQRARRRDEFILKQVWAVRRSDFRRAMLDSKPNIVHFCGHGLGEEGIAFEDENGQAKLISTEALSGFFELFADTVECVVLNACYSEVQAEAIAEHIPHVIGMNKAIGDTAAIEFAVAFYDALGAGESIEFAYKLAYNAIQWTGIPEHLTPILKSKANSAADNLTYYQPLPKPFDVFLSYSSADTNWVTRLKSDLEQRGIKVWFDRDQIRPGSFFAEAIGKGLVDSKTFIIVVSPDSIQSSWVRDEYHRALSFTNKGGLHIIPVIINNATPPDFLSGRQCIDFSDEALYQDNINRLIWPGITGKFVTIGWVVPKIEHHNCACYDQLLKSELYKLISHITDAVVSPSSVDANPFLLTPSPHYAGGQDGVRRVFFVNLFQDILCAKCSGIFSPKYYADFIFSIREMTKGTKGEVVFVLFNKAEAFSSKHDLDANSLKRLEHYFIVNYDKESQELESELRDLWNKIQRLLLSTERSFTTETFVEVSDIGVFAIYPETKCIRRMRVKFLLNCFVQTDLISVYYENDGLVFSFKGIPIKLVTRRTDYKFFEVGSDNDKFTLTPTGYNGVKLDTSREMSLEIASRPSGALGSQIIIRIEFL